MLRPLILLGTILATAGIATAAVPPDEIHYQGVLRDESGVALDGDHDIVFRFFSAATGGQEILVDTHDTANGNPVTVDEGLLSVALGSGAVRDGAGPGEYRSLAEVFEDFTDVWLGITVDGEPLAPRVRLLSVGHALSAGHAVDTDNLGGRSAGFYLDTSSNSQTKDGLLGVESLEVGREVIVESSGAQLRSTHSSGNDTILSAGPDHDLELWAGSGDGGWIEIDDGGRVTLAAGNGRFSLLDLADASNEIVTIYGGGDLSVDGELLSAGGAVALGQSLDGRVAIDGSGAFSSMEFGFASFNAVDGYLRVERGEDVVVYAGDDVRFAPGGTGLRSVVIHSDGSLQAYGGFRLNNGDINVNEDGPNRKQQIQFYEDGENRERFQWDGDPDSKRFEFSDDTHIFGELSASTKNFVQNHPERDDLQVVYTSLEGDEAAVFTRGTGRLVDGEARVELGPTFRLVTNPDLGLTVHLTPRGEWAELYAVRVTPEELVVRSGPGSPDGVVFDYVVFGLRIGYESFPVIREKKDEAFLPPAGWYEAETKGDPALRAATAWSRHAATYQGIYGGSEPPTAGARALRRAIGERPPGLVYERGSDVPVRDLPRAADDRHREISNEVLHEPPARASRLRQRPEEANPPGATVAAADRTARMEVVRADSFLSTSPDLGHRMPVAEPVEAGDVVAVDSATGKIRRARTAEDPRVVGIVAAEPGLVLGATGAEPTMAVDDAEAPVALAGVVQCRVDAEYGAVQPGDLLAASPTPGHAMRARGALPGTIVGKALEEHLDGRGAIRVLVMLR